MCFNKSKLSKHKKVKIAGRNIDCYKILEKQYGRFIAPYQPMIYFETTNPNECVEKNATFTLHHDSDMVHDLYEGLHSYSDLGMVLTYQSSIRKIFHAIIPKGTRYYYNEMYEEYISEKLIVKPFII